MTTTPSPELPDLDLDRMEALARAATPGEWKAKRFGCVVGGPMRKYVNGSAQAQIAAFNVTFHDQAPDDEPERQQANAEFCAAANPSAVLALIALARRPPVPATRPTDDELWDSTLRDRDNNQEWADKLADAIAIHFGVDIGEHSNANCPWHEALEAIESAPPVAQPEGEAPQAVAKLRTTDLVDRIVSELLIRRVFHAKQRDMESIGAALCSIVENSGAFAPAAQHAESGAPAQDAERVDAIVTGLYRRFKDWSKRGFGPDDVTWCEVKADVIALIASGGAALAAQSQGAPVARFHWSKRGMELDPNGYYVAYSAPGTPEAPQTAAARDVLAERQRQVEVEGWAPARDDCYVKEELRSAALCYMRWKDITKPGIPPGAWPWNTRWWKPADDRRNMVKATALMLAEIERLDRAAQIDTALEAPKGGA